MNLPPPSEPNSEPAVVRFDLSLRSIFLVVAAVAAVWMLLHLVPAILVVATALMLVGALNPFVAWLERKRMRRGIAIAIVFVSLALVSSALLVLILPSLGAQVKSLLEHAPEYRTKLIDRLAQSPTTSSIAEQLRSAHFDELLKASQATLISITRSLFEMIAAGVAVLFFSIYIMIDHDRLRGALFAIVPRSRHMRLSRILLNLETIVGGYIRGQVVTCVLMASYILVVLLVCRVPNALAIAAFGGIMDLLPYIGIVLTMAPAVAAALVKGPVIAVTVFVLLFIYEEFEGRLLIPLVYGRALRLPSSVVFLSLLVGSSLAGVIGALFALPVAAAVLMLIEELRVELPGETEQPVDRVEHRKEERTEEEYKHLAEGLPATEAAAVAVEMARKTKSEEEAASDKGKKNGV